MKKTSYGVWRLILLSLLAALGLSPVRISTWNFNGSEILPAKDVSYLTKKTHSTNPVRASISEQDFCLEKKHDQATIHSCEGLQDVIYWESPIAWQVREAFFADLNRDGKLEAVLLVRRPFAPWPIDRFVPNGGRIKDFHDREGFSCHVILLGWRDGKFKEAWAGSSMVAPIRQLSAVDLDGDGEQELAALEYDYDKNEKIGGLVIWEWNGFGFSLKDRQAGPFSRLSVITDRESTWLVTH